MKTLYLRIYATLVVVLLLFALVAGWIISRNLEHRRAEVDAEIAERITAWGDLVVNNLPADTAPAAEQQAALTDWADRLGLALALDDSKGRRIATSNGFAREEEDHDVRREPMFGMVDVPIADGRVLRLLRHGPPMRWRDRDRDRDGDRDRGRDRDRDREPGRFGPGSERSDVGPGARRFGPPPPSLWWFASTGNLATALVVLFIAVAAGAYPLVRRLTRRLESLKQGVEAFGAGALHQRVKVDGSDEVAALATSFNLAASQVEALVRSHQSLLANASHELRSPLARMKMAVSMMEVASPAQREQLKAEIDTNIAELDSLVEEVLLASRLDSSDGIERSDDIDLLALAAEEANRIGATAQGESVKFAGNERLLRRALRNLLENARRYGGDDVLAEVKSRSADVVLRVCDKGPGVPAELRERIFEPFYRLPGHAEQAGGVGLGLSLVRQIAERHGGTVACESRDGGGSCFVITLPGTPPGALHGALHGTPPGAPLGAPPSAMATPSRR